MQFFKFDDICYKQTFGTPMGSTLSPIIADITLQNLVMRAVETLPFNLPFYYRYVDEIALVTPSFMLNVVLDTFNSFHPRLQFTLEEGVDNRLDFLDVTMILNNNFLTFDWYHKPTFSGRYLHFESRHPLCHKKGIAISLFDRAFRLSHPSFHQKNLDFVINTLLTNGYSLTFIFNTIQKRLKTLIFTHNKLKFDKMNTMINTDETSEPHAFF